MVDEDKLISELTFKAIRSSSSGGQHVNKVSSKVELHFDVLQSDVLDDDQKELLSENLKSRLTKDGVLIMQCGETRSQHQNKQLVIKRFLELITEGLKTEKKRIPTKKPKAVERKRLENKRKQSQKKANRKKPDPDQ